MKFKLLPLMLAMLAPLSAAAAGADGASAKFTVSQETMIPGTTLQPGTYSIQVMDHLQDRFVLRIQGAGGTDHTLFLGVPSTSLKSSGDSGAVAYASGPSGKAALRGFVFGGSTAIEFVYPKNDAVALAKLNEKKVLAVDPASEGKSEQLGNLNKDEMQMVTLWMLTPTPVGNGGDPQIAAAKYQNQVASLTPHRPAAVKSLPHTASVFPTMILIGIVAMLGGGLLSWRRIASQPAA